MESLKKPMNYDNPAPTFDGSYSVPTDLYTFRTIVEEVATDTYSGRTYIKLEGIATKFWVSNPVQLKLNDGVKLMFHAEERDD